MTPPCNMRSVRPRSSLRCLLQCRLSSRVNPVRSFSATTQRLHIGPESPKFIEIPRPPQQEAKIRPRIRGTLPVPRSIFPRQKTRNNPFVKLTIFDRLDSPVPEPTSARKLTEPRDPRIAYNRRLSALRRQHLRTGLQQLYSRKERYDAFVAKRSEKKQADRAKRIKDSMREDDRLTSTTITAAMQKLQIGTMPDPNRESRIKESRQRVEAMAARKEEQRRDALHTLYVHARDFITTEAELGKQIDEIFVEMPFKKGEMASGATNIWDAYGVPTTVDDMLRVVNNSQKSAVAYHAKPAVITGKRILKIAEELTGGKMDDK